jgi:hypothetical protein
MALCTISMCCLVVSTSTTRGGTRRWQWQQTVAMLVVLSRGKAKSKRRNVENIYISEDANGGLGIGAIGGA